MRGGTGFLPFPLFGSSERDAKPFTRAVDTTDTPSFLIVTPRRGWFEPTDVASTLHVAELAWPDRETATDVAH